MYRRCERPGCVGTATHGRYCGDCASNVRRRRSTVPVTVVAGPPCAGKSTYVEQRRGPHDLVIDLDAIKHALGNATHAVDDRRLPFACAARDAVIARLDRASDVPHVWLITTGARRVQRDVIAGATVVVLETPAEICHERAAGHRPREWHEFIEQWFMDYEP